MSSSNDEIVISFSQVWNIIKRVWLICFLIIAFSATAFFIITQIFLEPVYTANAKMVIVQKNEANKSITYNDVQLSQKLVDTYSEILISEAISDDVLRNLNLDSLLDTEDYTKMVKIYSANNTEVITVSVTTNNPKLSADVANEVVYVFMSKIYNIMQVENVTVLNQAKVPIMPSGPSTIRNVIIGIGVGIMISLGVILFILLTDRKVKTEEEIKEIFNTPIIGIIPDMPELGGKKR